jgi:hypothetical protein
MTVAAAGGAFAGCALLAILWAALTLRVQARRIVRGGRPEVLATTIDRPSFGALVAIMLVCQGSAHLALLAAGTPAHTGAESPLIHVVVAVAAAALLTATLRFAAASVSMLAEAVAAVFAAPKPAAWSSRPANAAASCTQPGRVCGRAPPLLT